MTIYSDNGVSRILFYFIVSLWYSRAYLRGGSNPPPQKFSDFYLKSEGKEVERKKMKGMGVGCKLLIYFLGLSFQGGVEKFFFGGGG